MSEVSSRAHTHAHTANGARPGKLFWPGWHLRQRVSTLVGALWVDGSLSAPRCERWCRDRGHGPVAHRAHPPHMNALRTLMSQDLSGACTPYRPHIRLASSMA